MRRCHVYLVPGFFGFTALGAFSYFARVAETLRTLLRERHGIEATVVSCRTKPTASVVWRAEGLHEEIVQTGGLAAEELHFVGHSLGGVDVRLLLAPGAKLAVNETARARILAATRSLTTVSTPHRGTPVASFFTTLPGRQMLRILATLATRSLSRRTLVLGAQAMAWVAIRGTSLEYLSRNLLRDLTYDAKHPVWAYVQEMASDQGSIIQLTPEAMHLFNAAAGDAQGVKYGCVVTATQPPRLSSMFRHWLRPYTAWTHFLYYLLYRLAARKHRHYPYVEAPPRLEEALGFPVDEHTSDGVAPTLSQLYGDLLHVTVGDHLDVIGQFAGSAGENLADWFGSDAGFDEARFQSLWTAVADRIAGAAGP